MHVDNQDIPNCCKKKRKKKFGLFLDRKTKQKSEQFRKFLCKRIVKMREWKRDSQFFSSSSSLFVMCKMKFVKRMR